MNGIRKAFNTHCCIVDTDCACEFMISSFTPVDFQPSRFFLHTYYYTRKQLELASQQSADGVSGERLDLGAEEGEEGDDEG